METNVRTLFEEYERFFENALHGTVDIDKASSFYAPEFISATPAGVTTGKNDDQLMQAMAQGYAYYRSIGTKEMRMRGLRITPLDEHHCIAHVAWTAIYARKDRPDAAIDFDVHYLVQKLGGEPKIFGWVSGDEQAVLKEHGII